MKVKITEAQGFELVELEGSKRAIEIDGHVYTHFDTVYDYEDHRWNDTNQYIYQRDDGKLFDMLFDIGKTESQENGFIYNEPELNEVERKEKQCVEISYVGV